jgi:hypothetical protein
MTALRRPTARSLRAVVGAVVLAGGLTAVPSQAATPDQSCTAPTPKPIALAAPVVGQTFTPLVDPITRLDIPLAFSKPYTGDLEMRVSIHLPTDAALVSVNQIVGVSTIKLKAAKPGVQWVSFPFENPISTLTRDVTGSYTMEISVPETKQELSTKPPVFGWVACGKAYDGGKPFWRAADFFPLATPAGITQLGSSRVAITDVADLQFKSFTV